MISLGISKAAMFVLADLLEQINELKVSLYVNHITTAVLTAMPTYTQP